MRAAGRVAALDRRRFLLGCLGSSTLAGLSGCGVLETSGEDDLPPVGTVGRAALLAPLSGPRASLGQIMVTAASLGGNPTGPGSEVEAIDCGDTPESAVAAARAAVDNGAQMLLGPLFSAQTRAVASAVGRGVPVVSLSNDSAIAGGNLFVFGVTPLQSARAILGFAASRNLRDIAVVVPPGDFGALSAAAAAEAARAFGIQLRAPVVTGTADGLVASVAAGGAAPAAVYLPVASGAFEAQAAALSAAGIQLLGSNQWSTISPVRVPALRGAWFAAPDPVRFEAFSLAFEESAGQAAGVVAGLAFDAAEMARLLGRLGQQDREGLLREGGFDGVLGPFRLTDDGQCRRGLAVLNVAEGATTLIGASSV